MNPSNPKEYRVMALRDCPVPEDMMLCDTPEKAVEYWRRHIATAPQFDPERECMAVLFLNTRRRVKGHQVSAAQGTLDMLLADPRTVFRCAVIASAAAVILLHNHPSGEPEPSEADIATTRELVRAGQILKIQVLDHVIVGNPRFCSLRQLGYCQ